MNLELPLLSRANFTALILKCSIVFCTPQYFLTIGSANRSLATVLDSPVHFLSTAFADRGPHPRKQRPYTSATSGATLPEKTQGFAPDSVFTREFTPSRTLTLFFCFHTRSALAHYVVDMMMTDESLMMMMMMTWWHHDDTMMTPWWHHDDTMMTPWWHHDDTMMTPWWHDDDMMMTWWWHDDVMMSRLPLDIRL